MGSIRNLVGRFVRRGIGVASAALLVAVTADGSDNLEKERLVAWCIVPFDAKQRGPEDRALMLKELGLKRSAYDWRKQHVPTFEAEILAYREQGIEFFAFWSSHEEAFRLFEKYDLHPQVWQTLREGEGDTEAEKVKSAADGLEALARRTQELGCPLGLYNHGGWGGRPLNLVAVCLELRERGFEHVGIIYNFHHAHDQIATWEEAFALLKPYLLCLNLNGMVKNGDQEGKKILPLGSGDQEAEMLRVVVESGYEGPIGILDHRNETDTAETLEENLAGLESLKQSLPSGGK